MAVALGGSELISDLPLVSDRLSSLRHYALYLIVRASSSALDLSHTSMDDEPSSRGDARDSNGILAGETPGQARSLSLETSIAVTDIRVTGTSRLAPKASEQAGTTSPVRGRPTSWLHQLTCWPELGPMTMSFLPMCKTPTFAFLFAL